MRTMTRDNTILDSLETTSNWRPASGAVLVGKIPEHTRGSFVYAGF